MPRLTIIASILISLCSQHALAADVQTVRSDKYGEYWGVQYLDGSKVGKFCSMGGSWRSGTELDFLAYADGSLRVLLFNTNWKVPENTKTTVTVSFDTKATRNISLFRVQNSGLISDENTSVDTIKEILRLFASSKSLIIAFPNGERLQGDLTQSRDAMIGLEKCAVEWAKHPLNAIDQSSSEASSSSSPTSLPASKDPDSSPQAKPDEQDFSGTGIVLSEDGIIATNAHVTNACDSVTVQFGEKNLTAKLIAIDKSNDLAALRVQEHFRDFASFADQPVSLGEKVAAFGFPLYGALASSGNFTIGYVTGLSGLGDDTRFLQISTPVQPGNSGGPLINDKGQLVGVVTSKLNAISVASTTGDIPQNINFAIRTQALRVFLEANGITPTIAPPEKERANTELATLGKSISVLVRCIGRH